LFKKVGLGRDDEKVAPWPARSLDRIGKLTEEPNLRYHLRNWRAGG
jgi:hypothetical protein